jgi:hydrogenase maturation protein HypF
MDSPDPRIVGMRLEIGGRVQGVGFRPFVYRIARDYGLRGEVCNRGGKVEIVVGGPPSQVTLWLAELFANPPPLARPRLIDQQEVAAPDNPFTIVESRAMDGGSIELPPDLFCCNDCLDELQDPAQRRYRYPFINCTQCGPRYTLIRALPYDRSSTTMADFRLCPECEREYRDPGDRRYHAQPLACPQCGPMLTLCSSSDCTATGDEALERTIESLAQGLIVAVKGVGGYHLLCDATNEASVVRLRRQKPRPDKPLALLFPAGPADDPAAILRQWLNPDSEEERMVVSPERPIVLIRSGRGTPPLAPSVAPNMQLIGAMLPSSPLHHLLTSQLSLPLVATSANRSSEPITIDEKDAQLALSTVADLFLHHNRPIERPADDSLYRMIDGHCRPLRCGRGVAPITLELPYQLQLPTLACGAEMKSTIAIGEGNRAILSPHIGELGTPATQRLFESVARDLQELYRIRAARVVTDAHPRYSYQRWVATTGLPSTKVYHHHAHASALAGEHPEVNQWHCFTWDGIGLGSDNKLWGGEQLIGSPGQWRRIGGLLPIELTGGDRVAREPWRTAAALCWQSGHPVSDDLIGKTGRESLLLLEQAWRRRLNTHPVSSIGRLFDGVAALLGVVEKASFEGQGPMWLEQLASRSDRPLPAPVRLVMSGSDNTVCIDWQPMMPTLLDHRHPPSLRACWFHHQLADAIVDASCAGMAHLETNHIGLCGGVFQNRLLTELACDKLRSRGFTPHLALQIPTNDAAIAYGQLVELAATGACRT